MTAALWVIAVALLLLVLLTVRIVQWLTVLTRTQTTIARRAHALNLIAVKAARGEIEDIKLEKVMED